MNTSSRVESREEVKAYLANLRYALNQGAKIEVQLDSQEIFPYSKKGGAV